MQDYTEFCIFYAHFYAKSPFLCTRAARAPNFNVSLPATRTGGSAPAPRRECPRGSAPRPREGHYAPRPLVLYKNAPSVGAAPATLGAFLYKA